MSAAEGYAGPPDLPGQLALALLRSVAARPEPAPTLPFVDAELLAWLEERKIDSLLIAAGLAPPPRQVLYDILWRAQRCALVDLVRELDAIRLDVVVFKGAAHIIEFFDDTPISTMSDVDLLVGKESVPVIKEVLRDLDYRPSEFDWSTRTLVEVSQQRAEEAEAAHYELFPFRRAVDLGPIGQAPQLADGPLPFFESDGRLRASISIDVHHAVALNIPGEPLIARASSGWLGPGQTLQSADALWFTLSRYYTEVATGGKRSLRDLAYVIPLLTRSDIDWDIVLRANADYRLYSSLFYYLSFLDWLLGGKVVPEEIFNETSPLRHSRTRDWGWQLGPLFNAIDPPPYSRW